MVLKLQLVFGRGLNNQRPLLSYEPFSWEIAVVMCFILIDSLLLLGLSYHVNLVAAQKLCYQLFIHCGLC